MACSSHSPRMPCSARKPSKDEPTLPFFLFVIPEHLLHTLERESQVLRRRLLRLLDKAVQQHHAFPRHAENHPPDLSISQIAPHFPQAVCRDCDNRACQAASRTRPSECPAPPVCDLPRSAPGPTPARGGFRGRIRRRTPGASWSGRSIFIVPKMAHVGKDLLLYKRRLPELSSGAGQVFPKPICSRVAAAESAGQAGCSRYRRRTAVQALSGTPKPSKGTTGCVPSSADNGFMT